MIRGGKNQDSVVMKMRNMISHTWTIQAEEIESFELFKVRKGLNEKQLVPYVCLIMVVS